jgi:hypothetical protein
MYIYRCTLTSSLCMQYYDPRVWTRKSEESAVQRLGEVLFFIHVYAYC